jgi:Rieske Fe-S protein
MHPPAHTPAGPTEPQIGRRKFFQWLTCGLGALATVFLGVPIVGFLLGSKKRDPKSEDEWVKLGEIKEFPPGETRLITFPTPLRQPWDGVAAQTGVYVRYEGQDDKEKEPTHRHKFLIFAVNCAHLGCPVSWFPQSGLFMCPCHGGVYYANGERASGPPPRGLFRCEYRVNEKGELRVLAPHYPTLQNPLMKDDKGHGHG